MEIREAGRGITHRKDAPNRSKEAEALKALNLLRTNIGMSRADACAKVGISKRQFVHYMGRWLEQGKVTAIEKDALILKSKGIEGETTKQYARQYALTMVQAVTDSLKRNSGNRAKVVEELGTKFKVTRIKRLLSDIFPEAEVRVKGFDWCFESYKEWHDSRPWATEEENALHRENMAKRYANDEEYREKSKTRNREAYKRDPSKQRKRTQERMETEPGFKEEMQEISRIAQRRQTAIRQIEVRIRKYIKASEIIKNKALFLRIAHEILIARDATYIAQKYTVPQLAVVGVRRLLMDWISQISRTDRKFSEAVRRTKIFDTVNDRWQAGAYRDFVRFQGPKTTASIVEGLRYPVAQSNEYRIAVDAALINAMGEPSVLPSIVKRTNKQRTLPRAIRISARHVRI